MGIFHRPPYFGYNSVEQENPILRIFKFQEPSRTQITWDFWSVNILSREAPGEEVNKTRPKGQTSTCGTGPLPGRATHTHWGLDPPTPAIFIPGCSA
jgi:hypothetical protein